MSTVFTTVALVGRPADPPTAEALVALARHFVTRGVSVRVDEDRSDNIEPDFPTTGTMHVQGQSFVYSIYVFKKGAHEKFTKDEGILFTLNGQTHAIISKQFFDRKACDDHNVGWSAALDNLERVFG